MSDDLPEERDTLAPEDLAAAVDNSGEAVVITSANLDEPGPRILYVNPAFCLMTGYCSEEAVGRSPRFLQGPATERKVLSRMREALRAGEPFQGEAINYRKDGATYVVEWLVTPVRAADGQVVRWVSAQRDVTERRAAEDRQTLLVRELHHRVKNTLATVQAVLNATARSAVGMAEFRQSFEARVASLAKTHALITDDGGQAVPFDALLRTELEPYENATGDRYLLRGPVVSLPSDLAVPIGMALHELATNAAIHGALGDQDGRLEVSWSLDGHGAERRLRWTWNEHDGPPVQLPTREGFGTTLLNRVLAVQLAADVDIQFDPDGLRVTVQVPLPVE